MTGSAVAGRPGAGRSARHLPARVAGRARLAGRLARLELAQHPDAREPRLWARGFLSSRRALYPGLDDPATPYLSDWALERRLFAINSRVGRLLLTDKLVFFEALVARGLGDRTPEVYGTSHRGSFRPRTPQARARLDEQADVVVKPRAGRAGRGVRVVPASGIASAGLADDLVVQRRVAATGAWATVHPGGLSTTRVVTARPRGRDPVVVGAVQLFGTARSGVVDNLSAGGICCRIDLADGRLGPAVGDPRPGRVTRVDVHPDSGAVLTGAVVPGWPQLRDLAVELTAAFPEVDHVGWDLCLSPDGPLVVEGNAAAPSLVMLQVHGSVLTDPVVRQFYAEHGLRPS